MDFGLIFLGPGDRRSLSLLSLSLYMRFTVLLLQVLNPAPSGNSVRSGRLQRVSSFGQVEGGELAASYLRSLVNSAASYPHSQ